MTDTKENEKLTEKSLGDDLIRVRKAKNISRQDLAREVHIAEDVLEKIELSDWSSFPVDAYVRAYLNSIAQYLELDSKEILEKFYREKGGNFARFSQNVESFQLSSNPKGKKSSRKKNIFIVVLLFVIVVAGLYFSRSSFEFLFTANDMSEQITSADTVQSKVMIRDTLSFLLTDSVLTDIERVVLEKADSVTNDSLQKENPVSSSATIFFSADSSEKKKNTISVSHLEIQGKDSVSSWIGIRNQREDTLFVKEKKITGSNSFLRFSSEDTLFVTIGNRSGITKISLNGKEVSMKNSSKRTAKMVIFSGKLISGVF